MEPRTSCSASQELNHYTTAVPLTGVVKVYLLRMFYLWHKQKMQKPTTCILQILIILHSHYSKRPSPDSHGGGGGGRVVWTMNKLERGPWLLTSCLISEKKFSEKFWKRSWISKARVTCTPRLRCDLYESKNFDRSQRSWQGSRAVGDKSGT